jgi:hypothetical protein
VRDGVETRSGTTRKNDALHCAILSS